MHDAVFAAFDRLCRAHAGGASRVLEVGAMARADTLLKLPALAGANERTGINLEPQPPFGGFPIVHGNGNAMTMFASDSFDLVVCNSVLEHDARFWLTLGEIRRVLRPGGIAIIGIPGYARADGVAARFASAVARLWRTPLPGAAAMAGWAAGTPTLNVHNYPADYYRFSEQAMREVLLEGFEVLRIERVLQPPRFIGVGRKP